MDLTTIPNDHFFHIRADENTEDWPRYKTADGGDIGSVYGTISLIGTTYIDDDIINDIDNFFKKNEPNTINPSLRVGTPLKYIQFKINNTGSNYIQINWQRAISTKKTFDKKSFLTNNFDYYGPSSSKLLNCD